VKIFGWVHVCKPQGQLLFLELRDGSGLPGLLQTVFTPPCSQTIEALHLHREAAISVTGTLKAEERAKGGVELHADYWELIGESKGEVEGLINSTYILKLRSMAIHWSVTRGSMLAAVSASSGMSC
jgi:aspartyl/asparaginyl-tRNA synthetase